MASSLSEFLLLDSNLERTKGERLVDAPVLASKISSSSLFDVTVDGIDELERSRAS